MKDPGEPFERLDRFVAQCMERAGTPGLALALTDRNGLVRVSSYGYADVAARIAVRPETLFEIGSIGKCFTAIAVMQAAQEGHVDLHAPVTDYLPWFHVRSEFAPITLHHLLSHTAGIITGADITSDSRYDVWALRDTDASAPPGEHFHYSNVGYRVIGHVLEAVLGRTYREIIHARILVPLEMRASVPAITNEIRRFLAVGYEPLFDDRPRDRPGSLVPATWLETGTADGSVASTAGDMAIFVRTLLNKGAGLLSEKSFERMVLPVADQGEVVDSGWSYAYGMATSEEGGHRYLRHGGSMVGYASAIMADLTDGFGAVVLVNAPDYEDYTYDVVAFALQLLSASARGDALPPVPPPEDPEVVEDPTEYQGTWSSPAAPPLVLAAEGSRLVLKHGELSVPLERRGPDRFHAWLPAFSLFDLTFRRVDGDLSQLDRGAIVYRRDGAGPPLGPIPPAWAAFPGHYRSYNPWLSNFRVVLRGDQLVLVYPWGREEALTATGEARFRVEEDERSPEWLAFDTVLEGQALRAILSGAEYYRVFTP
ncbi:MAG: beta-lactamase family protein [Actinobacteria bacterium]|nr:MAG: beta-lactamase family protein [Actinomycetota bacterium]